ncbi:hypothetical protein IAU60_006187 [Kwoniella sp. DSM 27419]
MVAPAGLFSNRYKVEEMPDLTGKVAVVTGGSRGIGEATVSALVQHGAEVHILSATQEHADTAIKNISEHTPAAKDLIKFHQIDLGTLSQVIKTGDQLANDLPRLDILHLNAGIGVAPFGLTNDGIGNHFGVNNLAGFVLTDILLDLMKKTAGEKQNGDEVEKFSTRIVAESSELHRASPTDVKCESLEEFSHEKDPLMLYGRSKLLNILFIRQLAKAHLPAITSTTPILAIAVHPGAVATEQESGTTEAYGIVGKVLEGAAKLGFMSREQGAESALWAATAPAAAKRREEVQGAYLTEADGKVGTESSQGQDPELAQKFWDLSVKVLKEKAGYTVKH